MRVYLWRLFRAWRPAACGLAVSRRAPPWPSAVFLRAVRVGPGVGVSLLLFTLNRKSLYGQIALCLPV